LVKLFNFILVKLFIYTNKEEFLYRGQVYGPSNNIGPLLEEWWSMWGGCPKVGWIYWTGYTSIEKLQAQ